MRTTQPRVGTQAHRFRRFAPLSALLLVVALALGSIPSVFAQAGNTAAEAIYVGSEGRFHGVVGPSDSNWYRFRYQGGNATSTITVTYVPTETQRATVVLWTGPSPQALTQTGSGTRTDNVITATFTSPTAQDVFVQVINDRPDRSLSFVGRVTPVNTIAEAPANATLSQVGPSAENAQTAITVPAEGFFYGTIAGNQQVWYRFYNNNPNTDTTATVEVAPNTTNVRMRFFTGSDPNNLTDQGGDAERTNTQLRRRVNQGSAQFVYLVISNDNNEPIAYAGAINPPSAPPTATPTTTATPAVTATATATPVATAQPTSTPQAAPAVPRDAQYFQETRFRIDDDFFSYFQGRGRIETFGFPVSRAFLLDGCKVQIFQRLVAQRCGGGGVQLLNLLDPELFPYTQVNGSTFPGPDEGLKNSTPRVTDPNYDTAILDFVRANAPNEFGGQQVNFAQTFFSLITRAGTDNQGIIGLFNLEIWGAPISRPQRDPNNSDFIYQRFQRGIMHHIVSQRLTRGILLADYLKAIIRDQDLPGDLRAQAQNSRYFKQYCPGAPGWICRPGALPNSDLTFAFEQS